MLLFIISIVAAIAFGVAAYFLFEFGSDIFSSVCTALCIILCIVILIMAVVGVSEVIGVDATIAKSEQRYESLVYQLENDIYNNDNDLGKKELYDQVRDWNEDLAEGKVMQNNIWVGMFYPDIYDSFEFIKLPPVE